MTLWHGTIANYAKQLSMISIYPQRIFSSVMSPWPGRGLEKYKDSFNYWLSHSCQIAERSFEMLMQCWGIFRRIFIFSLHRWSLVVMACMKLHNLCIGRNVAVPRHRFPEDNKDGNEWVLLDNTQDDDVFLRGRARGD
jgi:hypothetical protein